jgi:hypothetical protein
MGATGNVEREMMNVLDQTKFLDSLRCLRRLFEADRPPHTGRKYFFHTASNILI